MAEIKMGSHSNEGTEDVSIKVTTIILTKIIIWHGLQQLLLELQVEGSKNI